MSQTRVYFLDAYNVGDPSFLSSFGGYLAHRGEGAIVVVDPTDRLLLSLEGLGASDVGPILIDDVPALANQPEHLEMVHQIVTGLTREVAATLTELQVPAVSLQGYDRGILQRVGPEGRLEAPGLRWLFDLVATRVVPVVSPLIRDNKSKNYNYVTAPSMLEAIMLGSEIQDVHVVAFSGGDSGLERKKGEINWPAEQPDITVMEPRDLRVRGSRPGPTV